MGCCYDLIIKQYYPGDTEEFNFSDRKYEIATTGTISDSSGSPISDYKLILQSEKIKQVSAESEFFELAMFTVIWTGDLDGDDKLDLLVDLSEKYSFGLFSLFLSSTADHGELVKLVAQHKVYYD